MTYSSYNIKYCQRCEVEMDFTTETLLRLLSKEGVTPTNTILSFNSYYELDLCPSCLIVMLKNHFPDIKASVEIVAQRCNFSNMETLEYLSGQDNALLDLNSFLQGVPIWTDSKHNTNEGQSNEKEPK